MTTYSSYKDYVAAYVQKTLVSTGARPSPVIRMAMDLIFASATEEQCRNIALLTAEFISQNSVELKTTEQPKLELKL